MTVADQWIVTGVTFTTHCDECGYEDPFCLVCRDSFEGGGAIFCRDNRHACGQCYEPIIERAEQEALAEEIMALERGEMAGQMKLGEA